MHILKIILNIRTFFVPTSTPQLLRVQRNAIRICTRARIKQPLIIIINVFFLYCRRNFKIKKQNVIASNCSYFVCPFLSSQTDDEIKHFTVIRRPQYSFVIHKSKFSLTTFYFTTPIRLLKT